MFPVAAIPGLFKSEKKAKPKKPAPPCRHKKLKFTDGGLYLACEDCPARYAKVQKDHVIVDVKARGDGFTEQDRRVDPYSRA